MPDYQIRKSGDGYLVTREDPATGRPVTARFEELADACEFVDAASVAELDRAAQAAGIGGGDA